MAGRRPTPTHLKILAGNPGKRPLPKEEPKPEIVAPDPPEWLEGEALREWDRIVPELLKLKLISELDRTGVVAYCVAYDRYVSANMDIRTLGSIIITTNGNIIQNPAVGIANTSVDIMRKFLIEFGMTPASRTKVSTPGKPKAKDGWEDF